MFNGISVLQRQIDKKHPNNFIQLKEDETRNRTKGIALFFIEKALVKEWIYYMIEPRRQDVLEFDKDSLKYTSFPPTFYNTGDGSEIRLTAWDVENIRRKLSDKLTTYQLVRQISEPSTISFEDFTAKVSIFYFLLWALFGPKVFETLVRNFQVSSVDWASPLFVALVIHFRVLVLWFVCRGLCLKTTTSDFNHSICNIQLWCLWYFILAHQWNASWNITPKQGKTTISQPFSGPQKKEPEKIRGFSALTAFFFADGLKPRSRAVLKTCIKRKRPLRLGEMLGTKAMSNNKKNTRRK